MIPKVIHYCWFSGDPFPPLIRNCIDSWKTVLPEYELKEWNSQNTEFDTPFAVKAFREKKWAFLTDYIRMKILYEHGGIFLDTDVLLLKSFNSILNLDSFWNFADNCMIEPVVIGAQKNNELVLQCKNIYENYSAEELTNYSYLEIPKVITPIFANYGFLLNNQNQTISNNLILNNKAFCSLPFNEADKPNPKRFSDENSFAVHLWNANWFEDEFRFFWNNRWGKAWKLVWKRLIKTPFQKRSYFKDVLYHFYRQINS